MESSAAEERLEAAPESVAWADTFSGTECVLLVVGWLVFWRAAHNLLWFAWKRGRVPLAVRSPLDRYRRRLCRSQAYCACAVAGAAWTLARCRWHPGDLLLAFGAEHQALFTMAVGHWVIAIWEDLQCFNYLNAGMDPRYLRQEADESGLNAFFAQGYLLHHFVAAALFATITAWQTCSGVGMFGLAFELPVLLMNHREFLVCTDLRPAWFLDMRLLGRFWRDLHILFMVGRGVPSLVYLYSVVCWSGSLWLLPWSAQCMYHSAAIFFTLLNWQLSTCLEIWRLSDVAKIHGQGVQRPRVAAAPAADAEAGQRGAGGAPGGEPGPERRRRPPVEIPPAAFYGEPAAGQAEKVLIEISGLVYDVTEFLSEHPGGPGPLRNYNRKDATEAFHRIRHSMRAKAIMQRYVFGFLKKPKQRYRINEHGLQMVHALFAAAPTLSACAAVGLLLPRAPFGWSLKLPGGGTLGADVAPGLWAGVGVGALAAVLLGGLNGPAAVAACLSRRSLGLGACVAAQCVGLLLARGPLAAGCPEACPTGLELAAVAMFAAEDALELAADRSAWSLHSLLAVCVLLAGWCARGAAALFRYAPQQLLGAAAVAGSALAFVHVAAPERNSGDAKGAPDMTLPAAVAAALWSGAGLLGLAAAGWPEPAEAFEAMQEAPWPSWALAALGLLGVALVVGYMLEGSAAQMTRAGSARLAAHAAAIAVGLAGGVSSWRWTFWAALLCHDGAVGMRHHTRQDAAAAAGEFERVPSSSVGARALWDYLRVLVLSFVWLWVMPPVSSLVSWLLPEELTVWGCSLPIFDMGGAVDYGIAMYFAPAHAWHDAPASFECKSRQVDGGFGPRATGTDAGGGAGRGCRVAALREEWQELRAQGTRGLTAAMLCLFPDAGGTGFLQEVSLTTWRSGAAAAAAAADVEGELKLTLRPRGAVRQQDRCQKCRRLVEAERLEEPPPKHCATCGGDIFGYAYF